MSRSLLLTSLTGYYKTHPDQCNVITSIINGESKLSLRILDWFVTHYARQHNVIYYIDGKQCLDGYPKEGGGAHIRKFNLHMEYRKQLQSYTKMFFDPFRRHERISFVVSETPLAIINTTVGQLNFFRWATENHVVAYVIKHLPEIESHMASHQKTNLAKQEVQNTLVRGPCHVTFN